VSRLVLSILLVLLLVPAASSADYDPTQLGDLPPGEQYRQLSLIILMAAGAAPGLLDVIEWEGAPPGTILSPDDYRTPLFRIVDQESMLAGAAYLLRYAQTSAAQIQQRLDTIAGANPVLISMLDFNALKEDAIVIRNAIADAIEFSDLADAEPVRQQLLDYRARTLRIRNVMEYEAFEAELERLTRDAIASVSGKQDAYQRMFDEEVDTKAFERHFDAANYIYNRSEKFDVRAGKLTEEIMQSVILAEAQPDEAMSTERLDDLRLESGWA
jgi:hypothetical protein